MPGYLSIVLTSSCRSTLRLCSISRFRSRCRCSKSEKRNCRFFVGAAVFVCCGAEEEEEEEEKGEESAGGGRGLRLSGLGSQQVMMILGPASGSNSSAGTLPCPGFVVGEPGSCFSDSFPLDIGTHKFPFAGSPSR